MHLDNPRMVLVSIFSAIVFLVGTGIGVKLYSVTSESSSALEETSAVTNQSLNIRVVDSQS